MPPNEQLVLSKEEAALAQVIAQQYGISVEEAARRVISGGMEGRVRSSTGRGLAPVYKMPKKKPKK